MYFDALKELNRRGLTGAGVAGNFHMRTVLPLMERRLALHQMVTGSQREGTAMLARDLGGAEVMRRVGYMVGGYPPGRR